MDEKQLWEEYDKWFFGKGISDYGTKMFGFMAWKAAQRLYGPSLAEQVELAEFSVPSDTADCDDCGTIGVSIGANCPRCGTPLAARRNHDERS